MTIVSSLPELQRDIMSNLHLASVRQGRFSMRAQLFGWMLMAGLGCLASAQTAGSGAAPFDPHDISGVWYRVSPIQTFGNVPNIQPGLPQSIEGGRGRGGNWVEAPFTPAGKAAYDKNKPGYGPRASPPAFGNDPMGTCDP